MIANVGLYIEIIVFIVTVVVAAVWLRSSVAKQRTGELANLAETRGQVIDDLRREVHQLRSEVSELKTTLETLEAIKSHEIANKAVEAIVPFLLTPEEKAKLRLLLRTSELD